jgi:predicted DNA-binding mobile mystery protein A
MSASALARRLGMSHAGVRKLESAEANDAITLASLRKLAEALDCELHYALVPRTSLAQQLLARAEVVVAERMRPILHTMALEDQAVQDSVKKLQFESSVKDLIEGSRRELW